MIFTTSPFSIGVVGGVKVNFLVGRCNFMRIFASNKKTSNQHIMVKPWYVYLIIAVVVELLYMLCDKYKFIKSKPLRTIILIFVVSFICWGIYDLIV